jgi:hypothetical protein
MDDLRDLLMSWGGRALLGVLIVLLILLCGAVWAAHLDYERNTAAGLVEDCHGHYVTVYVPVTIGKSTYYTPQQQYTVNCAWVTPTPLP